MPMTTWIPLTALLMILSRSAAAQPASQSVQVAVNGPAGALLRMDGQAMGTLPLGVNLVVPAGPHRFQLELANDQRESDTLILPANRRAELNLSLSDNALVAVLLTTPELLLRLTPEPLPAPLRSRIIDAVAAGAKQEHVTLVDGARQAALVHQPSALESCMEGDDCHELLLQQDQVAYVLSVHLAGSEEGKGGPGACRIRAALLDVRTSAISARAEESCATADGRTVATMVSEMTAKLLQTTAARPRGSVTVTSTPSAAKVVVDGRWLGMTPFRHESFAGVHTIEVQRKGYRHQLNTVQVEADHDGTLNAALQPVVLHPRPRPVWRLVAGSLLVGSGLLLGGFGSSALLINGACRAQANTEVSSDCSPYYNTSVIGAELWGAGGPLAVAGALLLAIPSPR